VHRRTGRGMVLLTLAAIAAAVVAGLPATGCSADQVTTTTAGPTTTAGAATTATGQSTSTTADTRPLVSFTDQAGRSVSISNPIKTVFCTSPIGSNLVYTLAPDMLIGWNIKPTALEKEYIPEKYRSVVGLGGWYGKNTTGNVEEIIKRHPDVILSLGTLDDAARSDADRVQGLLNIPVIMVEATLPHTAECYRYLGKLLGREDRAEQLAAYADGIILEAASNTAKIPETDRVTVYYAEGAKGLNSDPEGSEHTEVLTLVGAKNAADVAMPAEHGDAAPVSLESVIGWNPQVILVASDPTQESNVHEQITTGSNWTSITAVKNKQVYQIPRGPFDWFDRPPSIGRLLGVRWVGGLLYPDLYKYDMKAETTKFYKLFYDWDLTDTQFNELIKNSLRTR
jgi:iron complex transport system substrate-binding protein